MPHAALAGRNTRNAMSSSTSSSSSGGSSAFDLSKVKCVRNGPIMLSLLTCMQDVSAKSTDRDVDKMLSLMFAVREQSLDALKCALTHQEWTDGLSPPTLYDEDAFFALRKSACLLMDMDARNSAALVAAFETLRASFTLDHSEYHLSDSSHRYNALRDAWSRLPEPGKVRGAAAEKKRRFDATE